MWKKFTDVESWGKWKRKTTTIFRTENISSFYLFYEIFIAIFVPDKIKIENEVKQHWDDEIQLNGNDYTIFSHSTGKIKRNEKTNAHPHCVWSRNTFPQNLLKCTQNIVTEPKIKLKMKAKKKFPIYSPNVMDSLKMHSELDYSLHSTFIRVFLCFLSPYFFCVSYFKTHKVECTDLHSRYSISLKTTNNEHFRQPTTKQRWKKIGKKERIEQ